MEQALKTFICEKLKLEYIRIENDSSLEKIYHLFLNKKIFDPLSSIELFYLGVYYFEIEKDYDQMKKYYLMAINKGDSNSMYNLGCYYRDVEKDYDQMKKYYLMAINKGDSNAMNNLAWYYQNVEKDYSQMKKYYLMAIDKGNSNSMNNLAWYYQNVEKDYDQMKKYYLMAIDKGNTKAMDKLLNFYSKQELFFDKMKLVFKHKNLVNKQVIIKSIIDIWISGLTTENKNEFVSMISEFDFEENDIEEVPISLSLFINLIKNQLDIMDLHFSYGINGKGYFDAKNDFLKHVTSGGSK